MTFKIIRSAVLFAILVFCTMRFSNGNDSRKLRSRQGYQDPKSIIKKEKRSSDNNATNLSFEFKNLGDIDFDDVNTGNLPCGVHKCFGRSKSNAELGYLLTKNNAIYGPKHTLKYFEKRYNFGECLNENYHIYTNVGYPHLTHVTQDQIDYIFKNHPKKEQRKAGFDEGDLIILPVRYDSSAVLLITCAKEKNPTLESVRAHMKKHIPLNPGFHKTFVQSIKNIKVALAAKRCLYADFQVFINSLGQVYLFDLDMCSEESCISPDTPLEDIRYKKKREEAQRTIPKLYQECVELLDELIQTADSLAAKVSK